MGACTSDDVEGAADHRTPKEQTVFQVMGALGTRFVDQVSGKSKRKQQPSDRESLLLQLSKKLLQHIFLLLRESPKQLAAAVASCKELWAMEVLFDLQAAPFEHCDHWPVFAHSHHKFTGISLRAARQVPTAAESLPPCSCTHFNCRVMRQNLLNAPFLRSVQLWDCQELTHTSALCGLTSLCTLHLRNCDRLAMASVTGCPSLHTLDISHCSRLQHIGPLTDCALLHTIKLRHLAELVDISGLGGCGSLELVHLSDCSQLKDFSPIAGSHKELILSDCPGLQEMCFTSPDQVQLSRQVTRIKGYLRAGCGAVTIRCCSGLTKASLLIGSLVESLTINECTQLQEICDLGCADRLRTLDLTGCTRLHPVDIATLPDCAHLHTLVLKGCGWVDDGVMPTLLECSSLRTLDLSSCRALTSIALISACSDLQSLDLSHCTGLEDVSALAGCGALHTLNLSGCSMLKDISMLLWCSELSSVDVRGCHQISDLNDIIVNHPCEYKAGPLL